VGSLFPLALNVLLNANGLSLCIWLELETVGNPSVVQDYLNVSVPAEANLGLLLVKTSH
jgi:hypothetical protein